MAYSVKEIYQTLQGEGAQAGRPAVFLRFSGCNLWSGREADRDLADCRFCDTDFLGTDGPGGGRFDSPRSLTDAVLARWPHTAPPFVVCTGGEPLLQLDQALVDSLKGRGCEIALETNGTLLPPKGLDWICVSPKANVPLKLCVGHELKVVYPQSGLDLGEMERLDFRYFFIQPMDGANREENLAAARAFCLNNARWRLSLQLHKLVGIR